MPPSPLPCYGHHWFHLSRLRGSIPAFPFLFLSSYSLTDKNVILLSVCLRFGRNSERDICGLHMQGMRKAFFRFFVYDSTQTSFIPAGFLAVIFEFTHLGECRSLTTCPTVDTRESRFHSRTLLNSLS